MKRSRSIWNYNAGSGFLASSEDIELHGVLDSDAELVFTRGHCHSMAGAIHELTGWSQWVVYCSGDVHVMVETIDDLWLDAHGTHTTQKLERMFGEVEFKEMHGKVVRRDDMRFPRVAGAMPYAIQLLTREGYEDYIQTGG